MPGGKKGLVDEVVESEKGKEGGKDQTRRVENGIRASRGGPGKKSRAGPRRSANRGEGLLSREEGKRLSNAGSGIVITA